VVVFPAASALISLVCAATVARDAVRRPRPDKIAWAVAFAVFAVAAGAEVAGATRGWNVTLARLYYVTGPVLVVDYLAVGELYLLAPRRVASLAPGMTLLVTALAGAIVWDAPVETSRLGTDGWEAIERGPALVALAASINSLGTLVLVGGALYSAWRFWRRGMFRHRMIGCVLIAAGTLVVATGGTLTRFGQREYLYIAMTLGVAIIYAGYLEARRPDAAAAPSVDVADASTVALGRGALVPLPSPRRGQRPSRGDPSEDPAVVFIETRLLPLDSTALVEACRAWSVECRVTDRFERDEARRAWALRLRLSPEGQTAFDGHDLPVQAQLSELYHEVLLPGVVEWRQERQQAHGG